MGGDEYLPCLKCDTWVPHYAKEIHMAECHELALKQFSHPYVAGPLLFGQVTVMGQSKQLMQQTKGNESELVKSASRNKKTVKNKDDGSNQQSKKSEKLSESKGEYESQIAEPEWLKKILPGLHYRVVLMNERDLIRCDITAYSPVEVRVGGTACGFLAIPEDSVRIGHIMIHQGSAEYLPELRDNGLISVKKIDFVRYVDELNVLPTKTFTSEESSFFEKQLKAFVYSSFPLGAPFTLSAGSRIYLPSSNISDTTFTVQSYKLSESLYQDGMVGCEYRKEDQNLTNESDTFPSELITIDECDGSVSSVTEKISKLMVTPTSINRIQSEEAVNISNFERNILTSTPKKTDEKKYNMAFTSKTNSSKDVSAIDVHMTETGSCSMLEKIAPWVRTSRSTKVTLQSLSVEDNAQASREVIREEYYKDQAYHNLKKAMESTLKDCGVTDSPLLGSWSGVLLYGPPGTGKTMMVHEVATELSVPVFTLTLDALSKSSRSMKEHVQYTFGKACQSAPSVVFIDEVDSLCPATDLKTQADRTLTPAVIHGIQMLQSASKPVFLVAATCQPSRVAAKLRGPGRLEREIMVPLPDAQQRGKIFKCLMLNHQHDLTEREITSIAKKAYGYSGADFSVLIRCAWLACTKRAKEKEHLRLSIADVYAGMQYVVPTMLRHNYSTVSMVKWSDIKGYQDVKKKLQKNIELHTSNPEKHLLKGLLLYGPPGCSKTMFVRALVHETSFSFFPLKCSNLISKYVGETEKLLSQVFTRAQQAAPSVVFMDEVDSLCGERAGGGSLVSELLSLMAQTTIQRNIMVIGATNRPHVVDEALLRPGFLEQVIHVDLPNYETRCEIWRGALEGVPQEGLIDVARLSEATSGCSGAEIIGVYQEAAFSALDTYIKSKDRKPRTSESSCLVPLSEEILMKSIAAAPPRTPHSLLESIAAFTSQRRDCVLK